MPPHHHKHQHLSSTTIQRLVSAERLVPLLTPFLPDPADREFVVRCILEQGPIHHRGSSFALLALATTLLERTGGFPASAPSGQTVAVPLRLPPHLSPARDEDKVYPLHMPLAPLEALAPANTAAFDALVDCLLDGPAHHALANAALVCAFSVLLERFPAPAPEDKP